MNKVKVQQAGGFPLETDTLDFMQNAYSELMALTAFGGDNVIVSGCSIAGANITDGFVVIAGELLPFKGGLAQTRVVIREENTAMAFENGSVKDVYAIRYATFGSSEPNVPFSDLTRIKDLKSLTAMETRIVKLEHLAAPLMAGGSMMFWGKAVGLIPVGWREVVDMRGRMPIGLNTAIAEFDEIGKIGGERTHQNTLAEMVPHDHPFNDSKPRWDVDFGSGSTRGSWTSIEGENKTTGKTGGEGGVAKAYSIMNPFRIVLFIEPIMEGL